MRGFDDQYTDLPDYILKCTAQIWEGRNISALDWHYADNLLVRTPDGISHGMTQAKPTRCPTLSEFPDRQLLGEDVIWVVMKMLGFFRRIESCQQQRIKVVRLDQLLNDS